MNQLQIYGKGYSKEPKRFKYVLTSNSVDLELHYSPKGWKESELTFIRDPFYKGVFESFSTNELTFVKDSLEFIQTAYETYGIDHEIQIKIYLLNNATFQYKLYFEGKLDLSTYKINSIGVTCEVIPVGFQNVVLNRDEIEVDMMSTKYIGGADGSMEYLNNVWQLVTIPEYEAVKNTDWSLSGYIGAATNGSHWLPMFLIFTEFEATEAINQDFIGAYFFKPDADFTGKLQGNIDFVLNGTGSLQISIALYKDISLLKTYTYSGTDTITESIVVDESITLLTGEELNLKASVNGTDWGITYDNSYLTIRKNLGDILPAVNVPMFYIYEAFVRTLQLITGNSQPFYSELLGRTDSEPEQYGTDGTASLMSISSGRWLRGFEATQNQLNFSLKDLFKSINALHNIGMGFETIGGDLIVRIEDEKYFFDITENPDFGTDGLYWQTNQILDLSGWLNNEMISKEVLPSWYANEITGGYNKFELEYIEGLKEFNTETKWAVPIQTIKSGLDLKSAYRADTQGVNKLREKPFSTFPTEDVTGDEDIFMFDVKRGGTYEFTVKTNEDFDYVAGGVDPENSYNLNFTPRRNLERHGSRINSMLVDQTKEIQFTKSDKNSKLVTRRTDETISKAENGDIIVSSFLPGYWIAEAYIFDCPVNLSTINTLQLNSKGVIKIGVDKYGWILEVQTNTETKKGKFKILRVNLNNVKIVPLTGGIGTMQIGNDFKIA